MTNPSAPSILYNEKLPASCCRCAICMEMFDSYSIIPKLLPCGHQFCDKCLQILIANGNKQCPTCRAVFNGRFSPVTNFGMLELLIAFETLNSINRQQNTMVDVDFKAENIIPEHKLQQERQLQELYEQQMQKQVDQLEQRKRRREQRRLQNQNSYYRCANNSTTCRHRSIVDKTSAKALLYSCLLLVTIAIVVILLCKFMPISQRPQWKITQSPQLFIQQPSPPPLITKISIQPPVLYQPQNEFNSTNYQQLLSGTTDPKIM